MAKQSILLTFANTCGAAAAKTLSLGRSERGCFKSRKNTGNLIETRLCHQPDFLKFCHGLFLADQSLVRAWMSRETTKSAPLLLKTVISKCIQCKL